MKKRFGLHTHSKYRAGYAQRGHGTRLLTFKAAVSRTRVGPKGKPGYIAQACTGGKNPSWTRYLGRDRRCSAGHKAETPTAAVRKAMRALIGKIR